MWLAANPDAGRWTAVAGAVIGLLWLGLLLLTGDLSWDDTPRLIGFTVLPAAIAFLMAQRSRRRWNLSTYVGLTLVLSLGLFFIAPFVEVALIR